jgi:RimJ/RimL family protein N-acetyltransferase
MSEEIRLRPVVESDLPLLERIYDDLVDASEYGFFGYNNPGHIRKRFEAGFIGLEGGKLAVVRDASLGEVGDVYVGDVGWHRVVTGPTSFSWNIGIGLLAKERGKGYGSRAQRLLVEYLFAHTQVNRIEAGTEVTNIAEQRALEKAGFTREGVLRGSCFRAGVWRDMVSYSVVRSDLDLGR